MNKETLRKGLRVSLGLIMHTARDYGVVDPRSTVWGPYIDRLVEDTIKVIETTDSTSKQKPIDIEKLRADLIGMRSPRDNESYREVEVASIMLAHGLAEATLGGEHPVDDEVKAVWREVHNLPEAEGCKVHLTLSGPKWYANIYKSGRGTIWYMPGDTPLHALTELRDALNKRREKEAASV